LDKTLQIHREIETFLAQMPPGGEYLSCGTAEGDDLIHKGIAFEQRRPARLDHPAETAVRKTVLEAGDGGKRMDHIAHGAQPDN